MADTSVPRRKVFRVPLKTFVNLSGFDKPSYEIASTIDISSHGARVLTRRRWQPNQDVSVRSIRGATLNSRARVAHCQPYTGNIFVIGIESYSPIGDRLWALEVCAKSRMSPGHNYCLLRRFFANCSTLHGGSSQPPWPRCAFSTSFEPLSKRCRSKNDMANC